MFKDNIRKPEFDLHKVDLNFPIIITLFRNSDVNETYLFENIKEAIEYCNDKNFAPDEAMVIINDEKIPVTSQFLEILESPNPL